MVFKGGEHGPIISAGDPIKSEIVKRISLPPGDKKGMPNEEKRLSASEIDIIKFWIEKGAPWPANSDKDVLYRVAQLRQEIRHCRLQTAIFKTLLTFG